jgi:hypothetical protein
MPVFPVWIEHRSTWRFNARSKPIPRELKNPAAPRRGQVREKAAQDRRRAAKGIMPWFGDASLQNLILKRHAFRVVLLEPLFRSVDIANTFRWSASPTCLHVLT